MDTVTYKKLYALIVILTPVLCQYHIAGGMIDFDVIGMVTILIISVLWRIESRVEYQNELYLLLSYTIIVTVINIIIGTRFSEITSIIFRSGKYCLYFYIALIKNIDMFDYQIAMRIYKKVAYLALFYIVIQAVFYYGAGITLPNTIESYVSTNNFTDVKIGRLRAFYSEPAAMAYAVLPFIACSLLGERYQDRDRRMRDAILISIAVVISTSGQGIVCLGVLWLVWVVRQLLLRKISAIRVLEILTLVIAVAILSRASIMKFAMGRVFETGEYGAVAARASGYKTLSLLSPLELLFGTGYGNYVTKNDYGLDVPYEYVNYSSLAESLFTTGIIGTIMLITLFVRRFLDGDSATRSIFIVIAVLGLGGAPLISVFLPLYLSLAFCKKDRELCLQDI